MDFIEVESMSLDGGINEYVNLNDKNQPYRINNKDCRGRKVIFLNGNGTNYQLEAAREIFIANQTLTIKEMWVGRSSSKVEFEGYEGTFNTVMFADIIEKQEDEYIHRAMITVDKKIECESFEVEREYHNHFSIFENGIRKRLLKTYHINKVAPDSEWRILSYSDKSLNHAKQMLLDRIDEEAAYWTEVQKNSKGVE